MPLSDRFAFAVCFMFAGITLASDSDILHLLGIVLTIVTAWMFFHYDVS